MRVPGRSTVACAGGGTPSQATPRRLINNPAGEGVMVAPKSPRALLPQRQRPRGLPGLQGTAPASHLVSLVVLTPALSTQAGCFRRREGRRRQAWSQIQPGGPGGRGRLCVRQVRGGWSDCCTASHREGAQLRPNPGDTWGGGPCPRGGRRPRSGWAPPGEVTLCAAS